MIDLPEGYAPSEDEPYMNPRQIEYFRRQLIVWREQLLADSNDTLEKMKSETERNPETIEQGVVEADRAFELRTRDRYRKLIKKIEQALEKMIDGTYGYCEETGEEIGIRRLLARPIANLSVEAQARHEKEEKRQQEKRLY